MPNAYLPCKDGYVGVVAGPDHRRQALAGEQVAPHLRFELVSRGRKMDPPATVRGSFGALCLAQD